MEVVQNLFACVENLPARIDGAKIRHENYEDYRVEYSRYELRCSWHPDCSKMRGSGPEQCKHYGKWEPIAFLAVWNSRGEDCEAADHNRIRPLPSLSEIEAWLVANGKL